MSRKKRIRSFEELRQEIATLNQRTARWRPDPHRRGRVFKNRKAYQRRARNSAALYD